MPVQNPGPRLFRSIPFRYIGAELRGGGSGKNVNVSLNVVPFVDMMTILVCFLLMVFSATGDLIAAQRGLQLPDAVNKDRLRNAPIIIVTRDAVTFQGEAMATTAALMDDASLEWKIIELYERLQQEQIRFRNEGYDKLSEVEKGHCEDQKANPNAPRKPEELCVEGLLIMQADKETPAKVLNRVLKTAYAAQYPNIMFAVNLRSSRP
jgi:biopolymer transport protein ExbD